MDVSQPPVPQRVDKVPPDLPVSPAAESDPAPARLARVPESQTEAAVLVIARRRRGMGRYEVAGAGAEARPVLQEHGPL
jgi:hypothetical protein